ncbi:MAG TPA: glycosyltransferase family 1 protein [Terriglobales bacterium]|nr:glycosyltransferase family 1 protein [Terriglobales bacterium]
MTDLGKKLRVGFDARWHNDSGVGRYVTELVRAMARTAHPTAPKAVDARAPRVELVVYEDPKAPAPGLEQSDVERIAVSSGRYSAAGQIELAWRIRRDRLDVFHSPFYALPMVTGCRVVVTIHDLIPFLFPIYGPVKLAMVRSGYRLAARKAAQVIAVSRHTAADVEKILKTLPGKVSVVYNAAAAVFQPRAQERDLAALQEKYGVRPPYVLAASARNWRTKNLDGALRALVAAQNSAQFQTVIYGPEEGLRAAGEAACRQLDLKLIGQVESHDLAALFRQARAFIFPSWYEGFGLPVVEAMACGCPVVTSNGGSLAEVAGAGAQVFDPSDEKGMAGAIVALVNDGGCATRWRQAALRRAADFSWEKAARETIAVYHRAYHVTPASQNRASIPQDESLI